MKKILFFGYYFYPSNEIGAVRISEITFRLSLMYDVTVFLNHKIDGLPKLSNVHYYFYNSASNEFGKSTTPLKKRKKIRQNWLKDIVRTIRNIKNSFIIYKKFKKECPVDLLSYDYIIGSYGPLCNLLCANYAKKKNKQSIFVADFRDPMNAPLIPFIFLPFMNFLQRKICNNANYITTVSNGYAKMISNKKNRTKMNVITNGFSKTTNTFRTPTKFSFLCVGSLYNGKRRFDPLFKVIKEMIENKEIQINDIEINYIGFDDHFFNKQIKKHNLTHIANNLGTLSREECLLKESESFFLLLPNWNNKNYIGVIPGKFYEYLSTKRKIISICSGNLPNSELSNIIKKTNSGFAIECDTELTVIREYIREEYNCFKNNIYSYFCKNIDKYNYDYIAHSFICLLKKVKKLI